jgi:hypothetical protein
MPKQFDSLAASRKQRNRARHPRYYALHPESGDPVKKRRDHYYEVVSGVTFRVEDASRGLLNYRVPRAETRTMLSLFPTGRDLVLTANGRLREKVPDIAPIVRVRVVEYGYIGPQQKRGRVRVLGLPRADAEAILAAGWK